MTKMAAFFFVGVSTLVAQMNPLDVTRKVVDIKHLTGERADRALGLLKAYMQGAGSVYFEPSLKAAVLVGSEKAVAGAEALLAKFDAPGAVRADRQIQLRVHLVEATPDGPGGSIPQEIASAVDQMKKNFAYKGYRLLDTVAVVAKDSIDTNGVLPSEHRSPSTYRLQVQSASVLEDAKSISLKNFDFMSRLPVVDANGNVQASHDSRVRTDLSVQQGQKLVVGKLSSDKSQNAIFLILTADVL